ncbi:MAG: DoxX family protein [Planctomycetota bacterium]
MPKLAQTLAFGATPLGNWYNEATLLLLRLHVGYTVCVGAGISKLFPTDDSGEPLPVPPPWFVDQVRDRLGFPAPEFFAWLAIIAEVLGGALLALGLFTRASAILVAGHFAVASYLFHKNVPIADMSIAQLYFFVALAYGTLGSGRTGLDAIARRILVPRRRGSMIGDA